MLDQALISGANFVLNVLLARWLEASQYGAYALVFSVYLFVLGFFQAAILEPLYIFGTGEYRDSFSSYLGSVLCIQALLGAAASALALGTGFIFFQFGSLHHMGAPLFGLAAAVPFMLLFTLLRGATYIVLTSARAALSSLLYTVVILSCVSVFGPRHSLSTARAFLIMGVASALVSFVLLLQLKPHFQLSKERLNRVWSDHWSFGKWELSKVGFDWVSENVAYAITGSLLGIVEAGVLKALTTLFLPLNQMLTALRRLILPHLATVAKHRGLHAAGASVRNLVVLYTSATVAYGLVLTLFGRFLAQHLYHGKFSGLVQLIPWFAFNLVFFGIPAQALDLGLRAVRSPKSIFTASISGTITQAVLGWPLVYLFGLRGVIICGSITSTILFGVMAASLVRKIRSGSGIDDHLVSPHERFDTV